MIRMNDRFEFERDTYGWKLHEWRDGFNRKTQQPTRSQRTTYHANIRQVCEAILDRYAGDCESAENLNRMLLKTEETFTRMIEQRMQDG